MGCGTLKSAIGKKPTDGEVEMRQTGWVQCRQWMRDGIKGDKEMQEKRLRTSLSEANDVRQEVRQRHYEIL